MKPFHDLLIVPLAPSHGRIGFHSGVEMLDRYLHKQAGQDLRRRISRIFVATLPGAPETVLGYYTLSSLSIELSSLPESIARKLPRHQIPAALLGRLAVDKTARRNGIGRMLLVDALKRTLSISDQIAIHAMVVAAISSEAVSFYEKFGFRHLTGAGTRLFLPLKSIEPSK